MMRADPNIQMDSVELPASPRFIDRTGDRYGRLKVFSFEGRRRGGIYWRCECDCGQTVVVLGANLAAGRTQSCGCLHSEASSAAARTHGESYTLGRTPEYAAWVQIKTRCMNPNYSEFHLYGGRGIAMCQPWQDSFEAFLADVGRRPSRAHSIDRFPDNDGNYEPGNVRWATAAEQANNRRTPKRSAA